MQTQEPWEARALPTLNFTRHHELAFAQIKPPTLARCPPGLYGGLHKRYCSFFLFHSLNAILLRLLMLGEAVISLVLGKPFSSGAFALGCQFPSESAAVGSSLPGLPPELKLPPLMRGSSMDALYIRLVSMGASSRCSPPARFRLPSSPRSLGWGLCPALGPNF